MSESDSASLSSLEDVKTCGICQKTVPKYKYYRWIRCINCLDWYHSKCARVALKDAKQPFDYRCVLCVSVSLINEAERKKIKMIEPFQHLDDLSLSWHIMLNDPSRKIIARDLPFQYVSGHQVTFNWIRETHFLRPFIVSDSAGLEMRLPENLTPDLLTECIGPSFQIDVIDVGMQSDEVWTLQKWLKYFTSPRKTKLYNLLSLEISRTPLSTHFQRPRVVREMDMTDLVWPTARKEKGEFPFVQNYILMSVAGCYTDFHIDFGGSSVFYHVIKGQKIFYLIEPSQKNIELYNAFLSVHTPRFSFLGDRVKRCYQLIVQQNETVFIPSGWIHAVYTPVDSIVFGGNFLHLSATYMQLQMAELECKNEIAFKFQFPLFHDVHWYAVAYFYKKLKQSPDLFRLHELHQFLLMIDHVHSNGCPCPVDLTLSGSDLLSFESLTTRCILMWQGFFPELPYLPAKTTSFFSQGYLKLKSSKPFSSTSPSTFPSSTFLQTRKRGRPRLTDLRFKKVKLIL